MTERDDDPQVRALLSSLRDEPVADDGFAARLHLRLAEAGTPRPLGVFARTTLWLRERPLWLGSLSGACTGLLVFALAGALAGRGGAERARSADRQEPLKALAQAACPATPAADVETSAEVFVVPAGKVALVQLHFAVDHDVEQAEFSVVLPAGLAFFSGGDALPERAFHWSAPLARGDNRVPLALIGAQPGRHRFAATATIGGEVVVHEVVLDVQGPV